MLATPPLPVTKAVTGASRLLRRLSEMATPPEVALFGLANAGDVSAVLAALCDLGVGDALGDGSATTAELATVLQADADSLRRLLRVAESLDLVRRRGAAYRLTRRGRGLRTDAEFTIVPWMRYVREPVLQAAWSGLAESVRTGRPAFPLVHGRSTWDWFAENPDIGANFDRTMQSLADFNGSELAALGEWPAGGTVCDLAGGVGTLLSHILATDASLRGILVDQPHVLEAAGAFLSSRGVADRVRTVAGDFFARLDVTADVFVMKDVLHDWDDESCARILATVAGVMRPGNRLVLVEILQDPDRAHPLVPMVDLTMMTQTDGGRQRSEPEFDALLATAGLRRTRVREGAVHSLVEAVVG